jgi:hypothetical protein
MSGWIVKVRIPGNNPDTRPFIEFYVARASNQQEAFDLVDAVRHSHDPALFRELSEEDLQGFGLPPGATASKVACFG